MLHIHESNFRNKINSNYKDKAEELTQFYHQYYIPIRSELESIDFSHPSMDDFNRTAKLANDYYARLEAFSSTHGITSQSKFASTFLEELSVYLFKDLPAVKNGQLDFFNKGIYAGMKFVDGDEISQITKDVDFCIGKKINFSIDDAYAEDLILPVVCVEVKTYLDATMFGEVKSSSKAIRSATPNSKTYVLMGYKDLADDHIIAARQDASINEMFALRASRFDPIDPQALYEYWREIYDAVNDLTSSRAVPTHGRLLHDSPIGR